MPHPLLTVGHGTHSAEAFASLLGGAGIEALVDVRIAPGSRRHPQFIRDALESWLPEAGIAYRWEQRLGGFRKLPEDSPDTALRNESFRAYAAYMRSPEFLDAVEGVLQQADAARVAVMCSESVWWRCHRRLIADHVLLLHGREVLHLMPDARAVPHQPTEGVRVAGGQLVYDAQV